MSCSNSYLGQVLYSYGAAFFKAGDTHPNCELARSTRLTAECVLPATSRRTFDKRHTRTSVHAISLLGWSANAEPQHETVNLFALKPQAPNQSHNLSTTPKVRMFRGPALRLASLGLCSQRWVTAVGSAQGRCTSRRPWPRDQCLGCAQVPWPKRPKPDHHVFVDHGDYWQRRGGGCRSLRSKVGLTGWCRALNMFRFTSASRHQQQLLGLAASSSHKQRPNAPAHTHTSHCTNSTGTTSHPATEACKAVSPSTAWLRLKPPGNGFRRVTLRRHPRRPAAPPVPGAPVAPADERHL